MTELRLGFAMGGGISLGTFSGAALPQAIKTTILRGRVEGTDQERFDRVVVDVFSGASAGAMSLALMLRTLAVRSEAAEQRAKSTLAAELGYDPDYHDIRDNHPELYQDLVAAQVVQDVQEKVWVCDIDIDRLLGRSKEGDRDLTFSPSLFDPESVYEIARAYLGVPDEGLDLARRRILADRVLYACTLSNLTGVPADSREAQLAGSGTAAHPGFIALSDGGLSQVHSELRVFDLHFARSFGPGEIEAGREEHPRRWMRAHSGPHIDDYIFCLREPAIWAEVAATALACGAFPVAFPPVVLRRRRWEFGHAWPFPNQSSHLYSYSDGGTFNNEPIREAFRLASFIDARSGTSDFERRIIAVDPYLGAAAPSQRVPAHEAFLFKEPFAAERLSRLVGWIPGIPSHALAFTEAWELEKKTTLERIFSTLPSLVRAVAEEAEVLESDKVYQTRHKMELRDELRRILLHAVPADPQDQVIKDLIAFIEGILETDREESMLPAGRLYLAGELDRMLSEERTLPVELQESLRDFRDDPSSAERKGPLLVALLCIAVDLLADLRGKQTRSRLVAIGPVTGLGTPNPRAYLLPGAAAGAFGSFMSEISGGFEVRFARYCAERYLELDGVVRRNETPGSEPVFSDQERAEFHGDLLVGLEKLATRVKQVVKRSHVELVFPGINAAILSQLAGILERTIRDLGSPRPVVVPFELRILVANERFELDEPGRIHGDLRPIRLSPGGELTLVTLARFEKPGGDAATGRWTGHHVDADRQQIHVTRDRLLRTDARVCSIDLPDRAAIAEAESFASPVFVADLRAGPGPVPVVWQVRSVAEELSSRILKGQTPSL